MSRLERRLHELNTAVDRLTRDIADDCKLRRAYRRQIARLKRQLRSATACPSRPSRRA